MLGLQEAKDCEAEDIKALSSDSFTEKLASLSNGLLGLATWPTI